MTIDTLLQQGIRAAQSGQREAARSLLIQVVEADERNELGWLWLSGVVDDPEDMRTCLQNVLDINPANAKARQGLAWIEQRYGPAPVAAPQPEPTPEPAPTPSPVAVTTETVPLTSPPAAPSAPAAATATAATAAATASAAPADPVAPAASPQSTVETFPCVYCGAPNTLSQERCQSCRRSLMVRGATNEKRSVGTTILGVLWAISTVGWLLAGLFFIGFGIYLATNDNTLVNRARMGSNTDYFVAFIAAVIALLVAGFFFMLTRGLFRRARWAYIVHCIWMGLSVLGLLFRILVLLAALLVSNVPRNQILDSETLVPLVGSIMITGLLLALTISVRRDFFGPMLRFQPSVESGSHMDHYNNGIAYKNRGMMYMATQEWEAAVTSAPRDVMYLHALGLGYAQIQQFDKARETLDKALTFAPNDAGLQESRAYIEQLAAKK
jgi:tetratricopeptide (TPR) repeat protein